MDDLIHIQLKSHNCYQRLVMNMNLEMCLSPGPDCTCYLLGNKGMHSYNGNPPTVQVNADNRPNIMRETVKTWENEITYRSKCVAATTEKALSQKCVCIVGVPGSGKTTALHYAALTLEKKGFIIYSIHEPNEFRTYFDNNKKQVFIFDDVLGKYSVSHAAIEFWDRHNDEISSVLGSNTKLMVAIRTQIFNQASKNNDLIFFDKSACIDFCDSTNKLDIADMRGMLMHCLTVKGIDKIDDLIKAIWVVSENDLLKLPESWRHQIISQNNAGLEFSNCFPFLCKVFCNEQFLRHNPKEYFTNPFPAIFKLFQLIQSENKCHFCGLVLCAVFDGDLTEDMLSGHCEQNNEIEETEKELRNMVMRSCDLEGQKNLTKIKSALNSLTGVYISHVANTCEISHAIFHDVVIYLFNETDPSFVIKFGTQEFIRDRIRTKPVDDPYMIIINDDKNIERLAVRLITDVKVDSETGTKLIFNNPNIDDDRLVSCLKTLLSDRTQTDKELIDTLFRQCMITAYFQSRHKIQVVIPYKLIEMCLHIGADCNLFIHSQYELRIGIPSHMDCLPLHISVMIGNLELTKLFLQNGADTRRVVIYGGSILHLILTFTKHSKLEMMKLLLQHGVDKSVIAVTKDRFEILEEIDRDCNNLHFEEVLPDNSIKVLTTDRDEIKHHIIHGTGKYQLVRRIHDNILNHIDFRGRNILHYSADDMSMTKYLLDFPEMQQIKNQRDDDGKTPFWYVINDKKVDPLGKTTDVKLIDKEDFVKLYQDHQCIW